MKMERKCKRESVGSVFEDFGIPRKRLRVEYLDEATRKEINIEDLPIKQTVVEEVQGNQAETPGKPPNTPLSSLRRSMTNKQMQHTINRKNEETSAGNEDEVEEVLESMKVCFEEVSKLLKAKDEENKLLKRSKANKQEANSRESESENKHEANPRESENEMLIKENSNLTNELRELRAQKRDFDANQNQLRSENKRLQSLVREKTVYIDNLLAELVSQSKEMNGLHARIRTLVEEKSRRKNDENASKVWQPCISLKPLSELLAGMAETETNVEPIQKSRADDILEDILIPINVVDGDNGVKESIVHDSDRTGSGSFPGLDVGLLQKPTNSEGLGTGGEIVKSEKDDLPDVLIDRVVPGVEEVLVKVENSNAVIDEQLDEEERELAELQRMIDEEEEGEKDLDPKDAESESGFQLPGDEEREKELQKEKEYEKEAQFEKESTKESDLEAENIKWKAMEKEKSAENESSSRVTLPDEGGREENEDDFDGLEKLNEEDTLAELLVEDETFEDVNEDEEEQDEEWDEDVDVDTFELEEVEKEQKYVLITSGSSAALEENKQTEVEEAIVIPTDEEELESLNLLGKENDDANPSWLDCPLCYSPFLEVEKKKHAASCKGVKELFEKEELATRQNCRLSKLRGVQSRSERAAEERQRLVTECAFFKNRPREAVVFNLTKEALTRCPDLPLGWQVSSKVISGSGRRVPAYVCPSKLLAFRSKVSAFQYIQWRGHTSQRELTKLANKLKLRPKANLNNTL